jgi:hypothetical protein
VVRAVLDTKRAERRDARRRYERRTALGRGWEWWRVNPLSGSLAPTPTRPATVYNDDVHPDDSDDIDGDSGGEEGLADDQCVVEVLVKGTPKLGACTITQHARFRHEANEGGALVGCRRQAEPSAHIGLHRQHLHLPRSTAAFGLAAGQWRSREAEDPGCAWCATLSLAPPRVANRCLPR